MISPPPLPPRPKPKLPPRPQILPRKTVTTTDPRTVSVPSDFDDTVVCSVFESTNNDHGCALDNILMMNAPSLVSSMPPPSPAPREVPSLVTQCFSQEMLDEQYMCKLAIEAQKATTQLWPLQSMQSQTTYSQSYQPHRGGHSPAQPEDQYVNTTVVGVEVGSVEAGPNYIEFAESRRKILTSVPGMETHEFGQSWTLNSHEQSGSSQWPAGRPPPLPPRPSLSSRGSGQPRKCAPSSASSSPGSGFLTPVQRGSRQQPSSDHLSMQSSHTDDGTDPIIPQNNSKSVMFVTGMEMQGSGQSWTLNTCFLAAATPVQLGSGHQPSPDHANVQNMHRDDGVVSVSPQNNSKSFTSVAGMETQGSEQNWTLNTCAQSGECQRLPPLPPPPEVDTLLSVIATRFGLLSHGGTCAVREWAPALSTRLHTPTSDISAYIPRSLSIGSARIRAGGGGGTLGLPDALGHGTFPRLQRSNALHRLLRKKGEQVLGGIPCSSVDQGLPSNVNEVGPEPLSAGQSRLPRKKGEQMLEDVSLSDTDQTSLRKENGEGLQPPLTEQGKVPHEKDEQVQEDTSCLAVNPVSLRRENEEGVKHLPADQYRLPKKKGDQVPRDIPCLNTVQRLSWNEEGPKPRPAGQARLPRKKGEQVPEDVTRSNVDQTSSRQENKEGLSPLLVEQGERVQEDDPHLTIDPIPPRREGEEDAKALSAIQYRLPRKKNEHALEDISFSNVDRRNEAGPKHLPAGQARLPRKKGEQVPEDVPPSNIDQISLRRENEKVLQPLLAEQGRLPRKKGERVQEDDSRLTIDLIPPKGEGEEDIKPAPAIQYRLPRKKCEQVLEDIPPLSTDQGSLPKVNEASPKPLPTNQARLPRRKGEQVPEDDTCSNVDQTSLRMENEGPQPLLIEQGQPSNGQGEQVQEDASRLAIDSIRIPPKREGEEGVQPAPAVQYRLPRKKYEQVEDSPGIDQGLSWNKDGLKPRPADQGRFPQSGGEQVPQDIPLPNVNQTLLGMENGGGPKPSPTKQDKLPRKNDERVLEDASHSEVYQASPTEENGELPKPQLTDQGVLSMRGRQAANNIFHVNQKLPRKKNWRYTFQWVGTWTGQNATLTARHYLNRFNQDPCSVIAPRRRVRVEDGATRHQAICYIRSEPKFTGDLDKDESERRRMESKPDWQSRPSLTTSPQAGSDRHGMILNTSKELREKY
ncbi:hypothetical protein HD554DRAFT_2038344 [Boletus coccyginus]|nr:hypothetical protein HD554DRAFT_2038344 [Boletus coccyginus]